MSYYELLAEERGYYMFVCRPPRETLAHFHSGPEFIFVREGEVEVNLDGENRLLTAGQGCFSDGFCVHAYRSGEDASAYILLGDRGYFERFFRDYQGKTFPKFFSFSDFSLLETLRQLCLPDSGTLEAHTIFRGAVEILCARLAACVPMEERKENKSAALVCEVLRFAETNLCEDLTLKALSDRFGYCGEHLSRVLHRYLRENWSVYVNRMRVTKAERLLRENDKSVTQIAGECGFDSLTTFYRSYRREFGRLPGRQPGRPVKNSQ